MTAQEMLALSGSAIRKIDRNGRRGTSMVTFLEIEALAALSDLLAGKSCAAAFAASPTTGTADPVFNSSRHKEEQNGC
jgi:hypothetical protein